MEYSVKGVAATAVGVAKTNQVVGMFFHVLGNYRYNHPPCILVGRTATLTVGKPKHKVEHAMVANLYHFYKIKHIKTTRGVAELHRGITVSP